MLIDHGLSVAFSTMIATYLTQNTGMGQALYIPVYTITEHIFRDFDTKNITEYITYTNFIIILVIYLVYQNKKYFRNISKYFVKSNSEYLELEISTESDIRVFVEYTKYFPQFYSVPQKVQYGDPDLIINSREHLRNVNLDEMAYYKRSGDGIRVDFKDTNFNINGYYEWNTVEVKVEKENNLKKVFQVPFISIYIEKKDSDSNADKYFTDIQRKLHDLNENTLCLYHTKVMKDKGEIIENNYRTYSGIKRPLEKLEELYINSFFHPERDLLWNYIKAIHFTPEQFYKFGQAPRVGYLLHGPPGTGKSTFAYRIAMALNRHIVSLDIRSIKNKESIYSILRRPLVGDCPVQPSSVVFMFDEFDLTVQELHAKKKKTTNIVDLWLKHVNNIDNNKVFSSDKIENKKENNKNLTKKINFVDNKKNKEDSESESESEESKKSEEDKKKEDYSMESFGYSNEDISIEDLLEIFQGPVPLEGAIIIATTNKFKEIHEICPALFRPGRLTPIEFNYLDQNTFDDITKYFYDRKTELEININNKLSPSFVIETASKSKLIFGDIETQYNYFINNIKKLVQ